MIDLKRVKNIRTFFFIFLVLLLAYFLFSKFEIFKPWTSKSHVSKSQFLKSNFLDSKVSNSQLQKSKVLQSQTLQSWGLKKWFVKKRFNKLNLKILTYSSFVGLYGPGKTLQQEFEKFCDCKIEWFVAEDSTTLLQRLFILPSVDLVIGLDQITVMEADLTQWKPVSFLKNNFKNSSIPKDVQLGKSASLSQKKSDFFIPIDWSPIGFISKNQLTNLDRLKDLPKVPWKISFPEPQSSTLGLQFYYWIYEEFQSDLSKIKIFLTQLKTKVYGPVFSWSLSYGYFQKGRVGMSLSYLSSLAYHLKEENIQDYKFNYFQKGHPYQVELAALPKTCKNCKLGTQFLEFLLSPKAQSIVRDKNYMFAVGRTATSSSFFDLKKPQLISYKLLEEFVENKELLLKTWKEFLY